MSGRGPGAAIEELGCTRSTPISWPSRAARVKLSVRATGSSGIMAIPLAVLLRVVAMCDSKAGSGHDWPAGCCMALVPVIAFMQRSAIISKLPGPNPSVGWMDG